MLNLAVEKAQERYRSRDLYVPAPVAYANTMYSYCSAEGGDSQITVGVMHQILTLVKPRALEELLVHEIAHALLFRVWPLLTKAQRGAWRRTFGPYTQETPDAFMWTYGARRVLGISQFDKTRFVTDYAQASSHEDWAETVTAVLYARTTKSPRLRTKFAAVDLVFKAYIQHYPL